MIKKPMGNFAKEILGRLYAFLLAAMTLMTVALLPGGQALAQTQEAPDALVKRISQEVLDVAKNDRNRHAGDARHVRELVESKILPYVDFRKMTSLAVGRFWREATPEQQKQLTDEFRNLLIHTYAGALAQVRDQKLVFRPLRADPGDTEVEVQSQVTSPRGQPIPMNYRLAKTADGWKIYDVNILGAWLVATYKGNFTTEVNRGGIDGLIRALAEKNRRLAGNAPQPQGTAG